jgi:glycosyltransferase involved in cell wall biosynthesis
MILDKYFLTFLIVTYRRPEKVSRLLNLFLDKQWGESGHHDFEIVIADDHGEDNTLDVIAPIIQKLKEQNWQIRYVYRDANLRGDRNLYYGYTRDAIGEYVWFLCDDDLIDVKMAITYLEAVRKYRPFVSICGFTQGPQNEIGNFFGDPIRVVDDYPEAINYLVKFPKTTAYLMRRMPAVNLDEIFERWDHTLFSWIGIPIYLLKENIHDGVLLYPPVVAYADEDFGRLRYSFRIFSKLFSVVKDSVELAGISFSDIAPQLINLNETNEFDRCVQGLLSHYSRRSYIEYSPEVLQAELAFYKKNFLTSLTSFNRCINFTRLIVYFISNFFRKSY